MTEKTKYKWLLCLGYIVEWGVYRPFCFILFTPILIPLILIAVLGKVAERVIDYGLEIKYATAIPFRAIFKKLGFYELHDKYHNKPES